MKKGLLTTLVFALLFVFACNSDNKPAKEDAHGDEATTEQTEEKDDKKDGGGEKIKDCEDFFKAYEKLMDEYMEFLKGFKENPMQALQDPKYMEYATEMSESITKWSTLASCATSPRYEKKFEELAEKYEKQLEELGFDD